MKEKDVVVYSCSGCSNVAQLANSVAVKLDRTGIAKMSCIAGVGGDVSSLVRVANNSKKILVLDGCPLECAAKCLERQGVVPTVHLVLTKHGLTKNTSEDFPMDVVEDFYQQAVEIVKKMEGDE